MIKRYSYHIKLQCQHCNLYLLDFQRDDTIYTRKLLEISKEYMLCAIEQKICNELIKESQLIEVAGNKKLAVSLLNFADEIQCVEAVDNCVKIIAKNMKSIFSPNTGFRKRKKNGYN